MGLSDELQHYLLLLDEGKGTAYERYALNSFLEELVGRLKIKSVLEVPANGVMGYPGLKSLIFAKCGCDVTLVNPSPVAMERIRRLWDILGLKATFIVKDHRDTGLLSHSYDLVWNFCVFEHVGDSDRMVSEMARLSKRYILIETQNIFNIDILFHRLYHKIFAEDWDHGEMKRMNIYGLAGLLRQKGLRGLETGGTDLPPWPDINMRIGKEPHEKTDTKDRPDDVTEFRPSLFLKDPIQIAAGSGSLDMDKGFPLWMKLLKVWHMLAERPCPGFLKAFFSHHPYVLAGKD